MRKACASCGVDFDAHQNAVKYCSRSCFGDGKAKMYAGRRQAHQQMAERTCRDCGLVGDVSLFAKTAKKRAGYESQCRPCKRRYITAWRKRNPGKVREYNRRAEEKVGGRRFWKYGITDAEIARMIRSQRGRCPICDRAEPEIKLVVDHDHNTGKVRSMLCQTCNTGIGKFKESPNILMAAIRYLEQHKGQATPVSSL